jgi:ABC-type nitrate/sulfonate/bicarbonate transport system substrate-binding protein
MRSGLAAMAAALGLFSFASLGAPVDAAAQQRLSATVAYYPGALVSLPALVASDEKLFERNGLSVELVPVSTGPAMTSAVASGSVTFVNNSWDNLLVAVQQGLPVRGVAGSTVTMPFALISRPGLPLPHLKEGYPAVVKDLVGKNWGVLALGVSIQYVEKLLLSDAGFKPDDVTYVAVGLPNTARPALQRGTVDTYLSVEPLPTIVAAKHEGQVIVDLSQNQGPQTLRDLGYNGWWASSATIRDKPELVTRFVKTMEDSYCFYSDPKNLDRVVAIMQRYAKVAELSDDEYKAMVARILPGFGPAITARTIDTWGRLLVAQKQLEAAKTRAEVIAPQAPESFACTR